MSDTQTKYEAAKAAAERSMVELAASVDALSKYASGVGDYIIAHDGKLAEQRERAEAAEKELLDLRVLYDDLGRIASVIETGRLDALEEVARLQAELDAEKAKTARLLTQIRNRELADTGLYDEWGQSFK